MDSQNYALPLVVSRATYDEIRSKLLAAGRLWPVQRPDGEMLDMRGVLLQAEDPAAKQWLCMVCSAALPFGVSAGKCDACREAAR